LRLLTPSAKGLALHLIPLLLPAGLTATLEETYAFVYLIAFGATWASSFS